MWSNTSISVTAQQTLVKFVLLYIIKNQQPKNIARRNKKPGLRSESKNTRTKDR